MGILMWPVCLGKEEIEAVKEKVVDFVLKNDEIYGIHVEDDGTIYSDEDYSESCGHRYGECLWDVVKDALGEDGAYARICNADETYYSMISARAEKDFTEKELLTAKIETVLAEMKKGQTSLPKP